MQQNDRNPGGHAGKGQKWHNVTKVNLSKQLHMQVFECHCAIHELLLLQEQHEETPLHVPQQVSRAIWVNSVVTNNGALLEKRREQSRSLKCCSAR